MVNNNIPRVSALEFATSFNINNALLKKAYLLSILFITTMFWIVFPQGKFIPPAPPPDPPIVIYIPKELKDKQKPPTNTVLVKVAGPVIPDPTPLDPERTSKYIYDSDLVEHDAMFEGDFLFPPVERHDGGAVRIAKTECSEKVLPFYPELARKAGIQGVVIVNIIIGVDGSITDANVVSSPGRQFGFDDAALNAVRQWKCDPTTINGSKVETEVVVTVNFKMVR